MKALVDQKTCIGCGLCADMCPVVFEMNADNLAEVRIEPVPDADEDACREAAESCPVEAITIEK